MEYPSLAQASRTQMFQSEDILDNVRQRCLDANSVFRISWSSRKRSPNCCAGGGLRGLVISRAMKA